MLKRLDCGLDYVFCLLLWYAGVQAFEIMGIAAVGNNLITYVINEMHYSLSRSANIVTNFIGTLFILALLGGFLSDSYLGCFWTMLIFGFLELSVSHPLILVYWSFSPLYYFVKFLLHLSLALTNIMIMHEWYWSTPTTTDGKCQKDVLYKGSWSAADDCYQSTNKP